MSKLSPKPEVNLIYDWQYLDAYLQVMFSKPETRTMHINPENYQMTKEEMIAELRASGYKVKDIGVVLEIS